MTRYRQKQHEITAVQWRGDNRAEVEEFLKPIAAKVIFDADSDASSEHWNGVTFFAGDEKSTADHWCDQGDWITVWTEGGHVVVMPDNHFRFDFEPDPTGDARDLPFEIHADGYTAVRLTLWPSLEALLRATQQTEGGA